MATGEVASGGGIRAAWRKVKGAKQSRFGGCGALGATRGRRGGIPRRRRAAGGQDPMADGSAPVSQRKEEGGRGNFVIFQKVRGLTVK